MVANEFRLVLPIGQSLRDRGLDVSYRVPVAGVILTRIGAALARDEQHVVTADADGIQIRDMLADVFNDRLHQQTAEVPVGSPRGPIHSGLHTAFECSAAKPS